MKRLLNILFLFLAVQSAAQVQSFIRSYGIDGFNYGQRLEVLNDTTYLLMGNKSGMFEMNNIYLLHVDSLGQIIKDEVFGGSDLFYAWDMANQGDTTFIITGYTLSNQTQEYDVFVMWIDKNLNLLNTAVFNAPGWDFGKAVTVSSAGMVYVLAETYSYGPRISLLLLGYDAGGTLINQLLIENPHADMTVSSILIDNDTLIYIAGSITMDDSLQKGLMLKLDTTFNIIDTLLFSADSIDVNFTGVSKMFSGDIAVSSQLYNYYENEKKFVYLVIDNNLNIISEFWGPQPDNYCNCVEASKTNDYVVLGCHTTFFGAGNADFHYILYNYNSYVLSSTIGGINYEEPFDIAFALDASIVIIGTTQSFGDPIRSIMFAKTCTDFYYCYNDYQHITKIENQFQFVQYDLHVFPNPVTDILYFSLKNNTDIQNNTISIYSTDGKLMHSEKMNSQNLIYNVDVSAYKDGLYFLILKQENAVLSSKFLKISTQ